MAYGRRRRAGSGMAGGRAGTTRVFSKVRNTVRGSSSVSGHLAVFQNPFSQAELQPVIPDGKATTSVGQRLQNIAQVTMGTGTQLTFILYPGLGAGCSIFGSDGTGITGCSFAPVNTSVQSYSQHGGWAFPALTGGSVTTDSTPYASCAQNPSGGVLNTWRLVSQGLRLSLINNSDQNDGWWESIRVSPSNDPTDWCFANSTTAQTAAAWNPGSGGSAVTASPNDARIAFDTDALAKTYSGNWVDNPTYITGKVRDIHKHVFQLHPNNTDHDFRILKPSYVLTDNGIVANFGPYGTSGQNGGLYHGSVGSLAAPLAAVSDLMGANVKTETANVTDLVNGNVDYSYDIVLIRISGRTGSGTTASPTKILSHLISNQECTYAEGTFLERFQRVPPAGEAGQRALRAASTAMHKSQSPLHRAARSRRRLTKRRVTRRRTIRRRRY